MKMGSTKIITLNDGTVKYRQVVTRGGKAYGSTFDTIEEAKKWGEKIHKQWLANKIKKKMEEAQKSEEALTPLDIINILAKFIGNTDSFYKMLMSHADRKRVELAQVTGSEQ